jgi:glutamate-1-semialdehyde 2,1-aminomutase
MRTLRSGELFARAQARIPGGVNSPVRAFRSVGGVPRFIERGEGSRIFDVDGNSYIDYVGSWGPLLLGHRPQPVIDALREALERGTSFGAPTEGEVELAELISQVVPSMEMLRLVNSGTEATMSALRVARGFTGRDLTIKFEGCYHGHVDSLLVKAGSGMATLGIADTAGVPKGFAETTLALPYNSIAAVEQAFAVRGGQIAAVIVEPVVGNMGCVPPAPGFLEALRELTARHGALLIFDEVMTGFRIAYGGARERFGVTPDLTTLGKVIGGGLPVAAYGGRRELMSRVAPSGDVYQAGTLSGNPLAMAAGIATLGALTRAVHDQLSDATARLVTGFREIAARRGVPFSADSAGSMWGFFFRAAPVRTYSDARTADVDRFKRFFHQALSRGVYLAPSAFEAAFMSTAHSDADVDETLNRLDAALEAAG